MLLPSCLELKTFRVCMVFADVSYMPVKGGGVGDLSSRMGRSLGMGRYFSAIWGRAVALSPRCVLVLGVLLLAACCSLR